MLEWFPPRLEAPLGSRRARVRVQINGHDWLVVEDNGLGMGYDALDQLGLLGREDEDADDGRTLHPIPPPSRRAPQLAPE